MKTPEEILALLEERKWDLPDTELGYKEYGAGFKDCRHRVIEWLQELIEEIQL